LKVSDTREVTFEGQIGMLWLDRSSTFTGKVVNFGAQDSLDLPGTFPGVHTTFRHQQRHRAILGTRVLRIWRERRVGNRAAQKIEGLLERTVVPLV
jgi:hypothetical protein